MNLGRGERLTVTFTKAEREKIEQAASLSGKTMAGYARECLLKISENIIKKSNAKSN